MPEIGEIRVGRELGYKSWARMTYVKCCGCGKAHWVELKHGKPRYQFCFKCGIAREQAARLCIFCQKMIAPGHAREVAIYKRYGGSQDGVAHEVCFAKYLNDAEFSEPRQNMGFVLSESLL